MTILYIWTIVAMGGAYRAHDWREAGTLQTPAACHAAAANLAQGKNYRCISQQTGEVK